MKYKILLLLVSFGLASAMANDGRFCIAEKGKAAQIMVDANDWQSVVRAANDLGDDVRKVSGTAAIVVSVRKAASGNIIVGTIGKSRIIDQNLRGFPFLSDTEPPVVCHSRSEAKAN